MAESSIFGFYTSNHGQSELLEFLVIFSRGNSMSQSFVTSYAITCPSKSLCMALEAAINNNTLA